MSNRHHHHRSHRRHDVYDDTQYHRVRPEHEVQVQHRGRRSSSRSEGAHQQQMVGRPAAEMDGFFRRAERDMERAFGGGLFSGNMFGGAMSSFDRMFDDATAMMNDGPDGSSSTYYYKSHTKTMGPDGVVREETVTTKPGADGNPETRRTVREGDRIAEYGPHSRAVRGPTPRSSRNDDVIIEEIDDDEDDGREPRWGRSSREESARHHASGANWFRDRYNRWASRG